MLEIQDVPQIRAPPFVDGLIGIADDGEVAMDLGQPADQEVLRPVGVLVLVDHHVPELARVELARLLGRLEELDRLQEQIVEVERVRVPERGEVALEDPGDLFVLEVVRAPQRRRALHPVPRVADSGERLARRDELVVDAQLFLDLLDDGDLVGRVVDHEVARESDLRRLAAQEPRAERMEGRQPHALRVLANESFDPLAHLAGSLVGEGDGQHLVRFRVPVADQVRDPVRDDARLSRACAGQNEQRPRAVQHGFALFGIELGEEVHWG